MQGCKESISTGYEIPSWNRLGNPCNGHGSFTFVISTCSSSNVVARFQMDMCMTWSIAAKLHPKVLNPSPSMSTEVKKPRESP